MFKQVDHRGQVVYLAIIIKKYIFGKESPRSKGSKTFGKCIMCTSESSCPMMVNYNQYT